MLLKTLEMRCERAQYRVGRKSAECNHTAKTARGTWEVKDMTHKRRSNTSPAEL